MVIMGSSSIISALGPLGLIDEYRIFVNPVVLGEANRCLTFSTRRSIWELVGSRIMGSRVVMLTYTPAVSGVPEAAGTGAALLTA
jgi:dihydrofolate reductase